MVYFEIPFKIYGGNILLVEIQEYDRLVISFLQW